MKKHSLLEIEEKVKYLLVSELGVSPATVDASHSSTTLLGQGIGLDSIETTVLVVALEEEFGISVADSDLTLTLFENIGTLTRYVSNKIDDLRREAESHP
jgi:acyl carrier protein